MKFRPLHDRVVVKRVEEEGKTKGGIIIPDTAKRPHPVRQMVRLGDQARWRGSPHHEGVGRHGRHRRPKYRHRQEEGGVRPVDFVEAFQNKEQEPWLRKRYVLAATPAPA